MPGDGIAGEVDSRVAGKKLPSVRVLILPKYGPLAASSRQRFLQFIPYLTSRNIDCTVSPLLLDGYLREKFETGRTNLTHAAAAFLRRTRTVFAAEAFDVVLLYLEDYPYLPGILARHLLRKGIPYLLDMDDAIFHTYDLHPSRVVRRLFGGKIPRIIEGAAGVLAGNEYLAEYSRRFNTNVLVVPTVIDTTRYRPRITARNSDSFTIGWIGSPSTAPYLSLIREPLADFCSRGNRRVVLVGSGPVDLPGVPVEVRRWSLDSEIEDLQSFDVGIMPLPDTPWARGKCGFKLIQYMGCSVPVVASRMGANIEIVEEEKSGLLASGDDEWLDALETLARDPDLRRSMGRAGRERVESRYSLSAVQGTIESEIREAATRSHRTYDARVVEAFGREWSRFDQSTLSGPELADMFNLYFGIFPWDRIPSSATGMDVGCGSGRWARFVAPRVGTLHCVDPSREALQVAGRNLSDQANCQLHLAGVNDLPFADESMDFGYSLGVLHHLRDTEEALRRCVAKLRRGAPFLVYLYYAFDNRPFWYRMLWQVTVPARVLLSRSPYSVRYVATQIAAALVYLPLARIAHWMERLGVEVKDFPLAAYRSRSFYVMRTDALDRFGTRIEKRFTRDQILRMMTKAGLEDIRFSDTQFWCAVGFKK